MVIFGIKAFLFLDYGKKASDPLSQFLVQSPQQNALVISSLSFFHCFSPLTYCTNPWDRHVWPGLLNQLTPPGLFEGAALPSSNPLRRA